MINIYFSLFQGNIIRDFSMFYLLLKMQGNNMPNKNHLKEITQQIVKEVAPDKIILFGSRAKKKQSKESDYDIFVLKNDLTHKRKLAQRIYLKLDVDVPVDIIVETPKRYNQLKDNPFLIYSEIAKYGRVIYEK